MAEPDRTLARRLARESLARGDATGWFDALYDAARGNEKVVPWADMRVNPHLLSWLNRRSATGPQGRALVIGCGLGDDAQELAQRGYLVTAFDISPRAIDWCRGRFPQTTVDYRVADVLDLPSDWHGKFDFVLEVYTLQVLPPELRSRAVANIAACLAPGGVLLVVARARQQADDPGTMPWPLTRDDLDEFNTCGLETSTFEDFLDTSEEPPVRRFRAEYRRGQTSPDPRRGPRARRDPLAIVAEGSALLQASPTPAQSSQTRGPWPRPPRGKIFENLPPCRHLEGQAGESRAFTEKRRVNRTSVALK